MATISKAQLKRDADKKSLIRSRVSKKLIDFKNQYIGDFVNYEVAQIKDLANTFKSQGIEKVKESVIGKTYDEVLKMKSFTQNELNCLELSNYINGEWISCNTYKGDRIVEGIKLWDVKAAQRKLELIEIHKVGFYADALKSYEAKIDKVVDKMCQYDFNRHLEVDDVSDRGSDFEILVWNPKTENVYTSDRDKKLEGVEFFFHARLIYANGMINRPHFRFITTTRKTYLTK
tara:strand:- start:62 stop:757 length:696 start_codon:yes stop_codon:yes gene_type:complete